MKQIFIYTLKDPITNQIRYVGKTTNIKQRLYGHIRRAKSGYNSPICAWIRKVMKNSLKPIIEIKEFCNEKNWEKREIYWIKFYRKKYDNLTNISDGGITPLKNRKFREFCQSKRKFKNVHKYDLKGNYIKSYKNAYVAGKENGFDRRGIERCLKGGISAYGFHWNYKKVNRIKIRKRLKSDTFFKKGIIPHNKGKKTPKSVRLKQSEKKKVKVIHIKTNTIFNSLKEAAKFVKIPYGTLTAQLFNNSFTCEFKYFDESLNKIKFNKKKRKIINIKNGEVFTSITEAIKVTEYSKSKIESDLRLNKDKFRYYYK